MHTDDEYFGRTAMLAGDAMMTALADTRVIVFGTGGVGSWCVEALVRSGIGHLTIVDSDTVAPSNINRQMPALHSTIGMPKVEAVARRLRDINPDLDLRTIQCRYTPDTASDFAIETYDYVIDAIDSLHDKAHLILRCTDGATAPRRAFYSSMGAARKLDPTRITTGWFEKVEGCPLARALRTYFRRSGLRRLPRFRCVWSPERLEHRAEGPAGVNGTFAHTTAAFGLALASMVITDLYKD